MGINWIRMQPKSSADPETLLTLVERQARTFQSMPRYWAILSCEFDQFTSDRCEQEYRDSSAQLCELLEFPQLTIEDRDFETSIRVGPALRNRIFPPPLRLRAHRTFLPDQLPEYVIEWKSWIEEVAAGKHRHYLKRLWAHETSVKLNLYSRELKAMAGASLEKNTAWANKPALISVRDEVLAYPVPDILPAPAFVTPDEIPADQLQADVGLIQQQVHELVQLTRAWDSKVKGTWKLRYYVNFYESFDQFLARASSNQLREFFAWADRCCDEGMGLFLDY